jgi:hypothetical protein
MHDPEKCAAVFPGDKRECVFAEIMRKEKTQSAMSIQPNPTAL